MTSPSLLLLRHASAGSREGWVGDDTLRPLDHRGRAQASGLPVHLARFLDPPLRLLSSPMVRCVQTVEPLAAVRGLPIDTDERLAEAPACLPSNDGWPDAAWLGGRALAVLDEARDRQLGTLVVCSHGEVLPALLAALLGRGPTTRDQRAVPDLTAKALAKAGGWYVRVGPDATDIETVLPPPT